MRNKTRSNWVIGQANGLGRFMATGLGHSAQNTNSLSIAIGHGTSEYHNLDKHLLSLIEELASLQALDHQNISEVRIAAKVLKEEEAGVKNIVNLYESFKTDSKTELFADDPAHMMEGYIKELFDDTIDIRYEALSEREELEKQGYTLVSTIDAPTQGTARPIGIFVSQSYGRAERLRGAVGLGNPHSRGLSLKEVRYRQFGTSKKHGYAYFELDKANLDTEAKRIHKELEAGKAFDSFEDGSVPIYAPSGKVVDYRTMMSKHLKAELLKQDKAITRVLSKTSASVIDKVGREEQNKRVLEIIKDNIKKVYDNPRSPDNLMEYTQISADHSDPEIRQLYHMLPQSYRDYINTRADKALPIPSILMHQYFGYKHHRFVDTIGVRALPSTLKHVLNIVESYWLDLVKIAKGNVLLKMPSVLIGNVVSNVLYAVNTGMPIHQLAGAYRDSFRDVKAFMSTHKELNAKTVELKAYTQNYLTTSFTAEEKAEYIEYVKKLKGEIKILENTLNQSEVKELFDIGMYQSVVEDIEVYKLGDTNRISDGMDKLLSKAPTIVKTPLQVMYLSKETAWYKVNQEILQLSDLVARDVMNRRQKKVEEEQADGKRDLPLAYRKLVGRMDSADRRRKLRGKERDDFFTYCKTK